MTRSTTARPLRTTSEPDPQSSEMKPPVPRFQTTTDDRAQAAAAAQIAADQISAGEAPESIIFALAAPWSALPLLGQALSETETPWRCVGALGFARNHAVRDLGAWSRLVLDPADSAAAARALLRPPVALSGPELARVLQIVRRRKLDVPAAVRQALDTEQLQPETRERARDFLMLYEETSAEFALESPEFALRSLVERLGLRARAIVSADAGAAERMRRIDLALTHAARMQSERPAMTGLEFARWLATAIAQPEREPQLSDGELDSLPGSVRVMALAELDPGASGLRVIVDAGAAARLGHDELAAQLLSDQSSSVVTAVAGRLPASSSAIDAARRSAGESWQPVRTEHAAQASTQAPEIVEYRNRLADLRAVLERSARSLSEPRFDTSHDVERAVIEAIELVKLAAVVERPQDQRPKDAIVAANAAIVPLLSDHARQLLAASELDATVTDPDRFQAERSRSAEQDEDGLAAFVPMHGEGVAMSVTDVGTYLDCPLRYKYARILKIPRRTTLAQRFGIAVHQVLDRFHAEGGTATLAQLLGMLDDAWRRSGLADRGEERTLLAKATQALTVYHQQLDQLDGTPIAFERAFQLKLGDHLVRGRIDRIDQLVDGTHRMVDYKTGYARSAEDLRGDIQLPLYAVAARDSLDLTPSVITYSYLLDETSVDLPVEPNVGERCAQIVSAVGDGIRSRDFEPTPSYQACSICDFKDLCPAVEL